VSDPSASPLIRADIGTHVDLEFVYESGETELVTLDIVPDGAADYPRGFLGAGTPLARAVIGNTPGSRILYHAGDIKLVRLLAVTIGLRAPAEDLSERREETYRKAVDDSNRTNILLAASSMNSKWGSYDLEPLDGLGDETPQAKPEEGDSKAQS
jgi:hypothetical protein